MKDWECFKVGEASKTGWPTRQCRPFENIYHTSHVASALGIIEQAKILPTLVFDHSKLNRKRILVSWLSPNHWDKGYRYGNIQFQFSFSELIKGKKFYWVEAIEKYNPPALRILITDIDRSNFGLNPYDPTTKDGPWWFDAQSDTHYYNNHYCLEFMFEDSISLSGINKIDFVNHNSEMCSISREKPQNCPDKLAYANQGGAWFIARAIISGIDLRPYASSFIEDGKPSHALQSAFDRFYKAALRKVDFDGHLKSTDPESESLMMGVMSAFAFHKPTNSRVLANFFCNDEEATAVAAKIFSACVGLENWELLLAD